MKFRYLGTAAAEGWPAMFCNCEHCKRARAAGGHNIRTRSQAAVNDDLLIDFPGDSYLHFLQNNLDMSRFENLIVTHSHSDHFDAIDLEMRIESCFAHNMTVPKLTMYGNENVLKAWKTSVELHGCNPGEDSVKPVYIPLYTPTKIGNYTVTALRANHMPHEVAYTYIITDGEKTILYFHDTGLFEQEVYDYLEANKIKADFISLDCTFVALPSCGGHMGLDSNVIMRDKLLKLGVCTTDTLVGINHFSHNGKLIYDELVPVAKELGFITSYDGLCLEI